MQNTNSIFCTLYLVRHGETDWNIEKRVQGHTDIDLNQVGVKQAKDLAKKLKNIKFDAIYSSDLLRAKKTAEIIALEKKITVQTTKLLRERFHGNFEGKLHQEMKKAWEVIKHLNEVEKSQYKFDKDFESNEELYTRFITYLRELAAANLEKQILVVSHGGLMRRLLLKLGFASEKQLLDGYAIANGAYVKLLSDGVDFFIDETDGINLPS